MAYDKSVIRKIDLSFRNELLNMPGGEILKNCFQCGLCTGSCIVSRNTDTFRPRQILRMVQLGLKDILKSSDLWRCVTCYTCNERCPQGVKLTDVFTVLKNRATQEGLLPKAIKELIKAIYEFGRIYEMTDVQEFEREELELPDIPEASPLIFRKIVEKTGLTKLID
ncbi:MAG: 4Fe-4S dicluster domain-containing protein [Promethearchaeota archaeon]